MAKFRSLNVLSGLIALSLVTTLVGCGGSPSSDDTATSDTDAASTTDVAEAPADEPETASADKPEIVQEVEKSIQEVLIPKLPEAEVSSISCPADLEIKAGTTFDCEAEAAEGTFLVGVTVKDDAGNLGFQTKGVLSLPLLEKSIQDGIKEQSKADATVDCGSAEASLYLFEEVGETLECAVETPDGKTATATVTVNSEDGNVNWEI